MDDFYFDYGFGRGGLGGRIYHGRRLILFTPDPERREKDCGYQKKVR